MKTEISLYDTEKLKDKIYTIRGQQVMLDVDLAEIYGYETKYFNRQIKNNIERFDEDFRFQLTDEEVANLRCKFFTSSSGDENLRSKFSISSWGGSRYKPYAFTEQGIYMLMTVLKGELAVSQSKMLIRMFKEMKHFIQNNAQYPTLTVNHTTKMHDRFLIIDKQNLYHIGASLKDLGKKCFAFEVLDSSLIPLLLQNL